MPAQYLQYLTLATNILLILFVSFYLLRLRKKEKELEKKETKIDTDYHHVVDNALAKERQILADATTEAQQIVTGAHYINRASKETVDQILQKLVTDIRQGALDTGKFVDQELQKMATDVRKEALTTAQHSIQSYHTSLQQLTTHSLVNFQTITKSLETDLQKQLVAFHQSLLPTLEKELEAYKANRLKETDQMITKVIQKASQEILNKSLSLDDHQTLLIDSLEKAKKEGAFE